MSTGLKANSDGSAAIQVGGSDAITLTSGGAAAFLTSPTTVQAGTAAAPSITTSGDTNTGVFFPAADTVAIGTGGTEALRVTSAQNVGIGTTSPAVKLDVAGNAIIQNGVLTIGKDTVYDAFINTPESMYFNVDSDGNSTGNKFVWGTDRTSNTGGTTWMTLDASGNLGIGTSSPTGGANRVVDVYGSGSSAINFHNATSGTTATDGGVIGQYGSDTVLFNYEAGIIQFGTSNTERARITSGGNFAVNAGAAIINSQEAIGAISLGSTGPAISGKNSAGATSACLESWNSATSGNNLFIMFSTETAYTTRGNIDYNRTGGLTRYNTTSDATLKNIIGNSDGQRSLEILNTTRIREFAWKDDEAQKPQIGVIAQELYETYKGAVSVGGDVEKTDEEGNVTTEYRPWGVDKTAFTFHLIAGWQAHEKMIQELKAIVDAQAVEIAALKGTA